MSAQESPLSGERDLTLTERECNALDEALADSGCHGFRGDHPDLYAAADRIVRERMAQAWDEGGSVGAEYESRRASIDPDDWVGLEVPTNPYRSNPPASIEGVDS